jgi:hypothetical protein
MALSLAKSKSTESTLTDLGNLLLEALVPLRMALSLAKSKSTESTLTDLGNLLLEALVLLEDGLEFG